MNTMTPEQVVEKQLSCYNAHDMDGFASTYSDTVQIFDLPSGDLRFTGVDVLRTRYTETFALNCKARIEKRIIEGNKVIDHEFYIRDGMETEGSVVVVYEVIDEKIQNVWFIRG